MGPELYLIIVIILFALAVLDLVVGVSNDAVNFLNSAIGSKVAPRNIIMVVASMGIFVGATFSSGMMEVARKGIFNPQYFFLAEIMVIFLAVMITDVILLDLFNTFGMPTSTTVSIVFELLGSAVAVSFLKILTTGESLSTIEDYINSSSAILIIAGIFLSVFIAFLVGSMIQYFSRLLFSFHVHRRMHWVGGIWSGLAMAALTYFLFIKGAKGASFITDEVVTWVKENTLLLITVSFVFWSIVMQLCLFVFKWNILRFVVLFGTFSLAMAFAGNDLVNFIGVPIAGFESYLAWDASGVDATEYGMSVLNEPVRTKSYLLIIAGAIMVVTLWFSKKAQSVTETEVNLGRQDEGSERFNPNGLSKGIVRYSILLNKSVNRWLPDSWLNKAEQNFQPYKESKPEKGEYDPPAFDLVRASVNLTTASILIAFATSLKLPLSTTYVSFMVAMGTSLSDRAWGRSSAVFRVAGVVNVIGGWFFTAIMAFTAAATFATLIYFFNLWAIILLVGLAIFSISRTFLLHRKQSKAKEAEKKFTIQTSRLAPSKIIEETADQIADTLQTIRTSYHNALTGLLEEDLHALRNARNNIRQLEEENERLKRRLYSLIKRIDEDQAEASRTYLLVYDLEQDIVQSTSLIVNTCLQYVDNSLDPIRKKQGVPLMELSKIIDTYLEALIKLIKSKKFENLDEVLQQKQTIFIQLESYLAEKIGGVKAEKDGIRSSLLFFNIVLEIKDLVAVAARFAKLYNRVQTLQEKHGLSLLTGNGSLSINKEE